MGGCNYISIGTKILNTLAADKRIRQLDESAANATNAIQCQCIIRHMIPNHGVRMQAGYLAFSTD